MAVFSNVDNLKEALIKNSPSEFFEQFVVGRETQHFSNDKLDFVSHVMHEEYGISPSRDELIVVGSSKLGFALHDKIKNGKVVASAFRCFGDKSDIDLSICSPRLFDLFWHELSTSLCQQPRMPFRQEKLGDYLTYGWLRLDQLKGFSGSRLVRCENLLTVRGKIRRDRLKGHPMVDFGIFHDIEHLKIYQTRSIEKCRQRLESPL